MPKVGYQASWKTSDAGRGTNLQIPFFNLFHSATDRPWLSFVGLVTPKSKQHLDNTKQCAVHVVNGYSSNYIKFWHKHKPGVSFNPFDAILNTILCTFLSSFSSKLQCLFVCPGSPMTSSKTVVIKWIGMNENGLCCLFELFYQGSGSRDNHGRH